MYKKLKLSAYWPHRISIFVSAVTGTLSQKHLFNLPQLRYLLWALLTHVASV